jgi:hypothetical protein
MNPISHGVSVGTIGELLVQLRLLEHGVQAAQPIKDSGNDLIAVKGSQFRTIQIKTSVGKASTLRPSRMPEHYHLLAIVELDWQNDRIMLDGSRIMLWSEEEVRNGLVKRGRCDDFQLSAERIDTLFASPAE